MLTNKEAAREARRIRVYRAWVEAEREQDSQDAPDSAALDAAVLRHCANLSLTDKAQLVEAAQRYAAAALTLAK